MTDEHQETTSGDRVSRRRVCQALSIVGGTAIAGCSFGEDNEKDSPEVNVGEPTPQGEPEDGTQEPTSDDGTTTVEPSGDSIDEVSTTELISTHNQAISGESYTAELEVQGEDSPPDVVKEITYKRSENRQATVSLEEISSIDDGIADFTQVFTPNSQYDVVVFDSGEELVSTANTEQLSEYIAIDITGASIFAEFLSGADTESVSNSDEDDNSEGYSGEYVITDHRRFNSAEGNLVISDQYIIEMFDFEWEDQNGERRWVEVQLSSIGTTSVDVPSV